MVQETMKATELIKKLVELIGEKGDADVIIDYDCRRITGAHHDTADLEYDYYGWIEIETVEEENHDSGSRKPTALAVGGIELINSNVLKKLIRKKNGFFNLAQYLLVYTGETYGNFSI